MRPPGARACGCHYPGDAARDPPTPPPPRGPESPAPWRPWILTPQDAERGSAGRQLEPGGDQRTWGSPGAFGFQHPVRLYLPISKRQEYLQSSGEKVLASFPVQATIHFYNDEDIPKQHQM
ncbi:protein ripply3 [Sorex fumeus]|uniref:protein ripply3 n=1 Tax=Sorex fumeus TaxID=62283 RepID=UPI0024AC99F2|nr:protein ripply3 [Sorex fumeus]